MQGIEGGIVSESSKFEQRQKFEWSLALAESKKTAKLLEETREG